MKRYALVAFGSRRSEAGPLFSALLENGCAIDSCLLTSFGPGFAATMLVYGKKAAVSGAVRSLRSALVIFASPVAEDGDAVPGNLQITLCGPNRPETLALLSGMISEEKGEVTEIESKSIGTMSVVAVLAWCPGKISSIRARLKALANELGLKSSVERIKPEDLI